MMKRWKETFILFLPILLSVENPYFCNRKNVVTCSSSQRPGISGWSVYKSVIDGIDNLKEKVNWMNFMKKYNAFHLRISKNQSSEDLFIETERSNIFKISYKKISSATVDSLKKRVTINFLKENDLPSIGTRKDWFYLISEHFVKQGSFRTYSVDLRIEINPKNRNMAYFEFFGKITGLAIYHEFLLDVSFSEPIIKSILRKPMESSEMPPKQQMDAFLHGLELLIPLDELQVFDENELDGLIGGNIWINVKNWKKYTAYDNCKDDKMVKWFWQAVDGFDNDTRRRIIQFATGSSRVPITGFRYLKFTISVLRNSVPVPVSRNSIPVLKSDKSFNILYIPVYNNYNDLEDHLKQL